MADIEKKKEEVPANPQTPPPTYVASDPEEDDLSDLDDVLDEFSHIKLDSKLNTAAPPAASAVPAPSSSSGPDGKRLDPDELLVQDQDAFAKELQKEMEQLLGQGDFQKQFEDIMKEMGDVVGKEAPSAPDAAAAASSSSKPEATPSQQKNEQTFQESIRKTMERMQSSGDAASAAAATSSQDDILAQMLKEMENGSFGGEGSDEDFSKILMGMMEQLTNKEILYEPMKELHEKFPQWMEVNKGKVEESDWKRYEEQQGLVKEIVGRFDRVGYSDENAQDREYIVERMQKMQAAGSPPPDLVEGTNAAQEALQDIDKGCPTQ